MSKGDAGRLGRMPRDPPSLTILIVHGAWVDATNWREVIALFQANGLRVVAVHNPLTSLADDVDAVTRAIKHESSSIVLVGHGYGGTVVTQAGNHPSIAALVYVAAFAPDAGECTSDSQTEYPPPSCVAGLEVDAGGFLYLAQHAVPQFFAQDLPWTDGRIIAAAQKPIRASALLDRVTTAAWHSKPSWYVVTEEDRMVSPAMQREIAKRINAKVLAVRSGHLPFLSKPKETADAIMAVVNFVRDRSTLDAIASSGARE